MIKTAVIIILALTVAFSWAIFVAGMYELREQASYYKSELEQATLENESLKKEIDSLRSGQDVAPPEGTESPPSHIVTEQLYVVSYTINANGAAEKLIGYFEDMFGGRSFDILVPETHFRTLDVGDKTNLDLQVGKISLNSLIGDISIEVVNKRVFKYANVS